MNLNVKCLRPESHFLYDNKACNQCNNRVCEEQLCVLQFQNDDIVEMIDIEHFFLQLDGLKAALKDKCDLMFCDDVHKIVFCEMSCALSKYVEPYWSNGKKQCGKRAKAYSQIKSVISKFMEVPALKAYIDNLAERVGLFALREKDMSAISQTEENMKQIEENMKVFTMSPAQNDMAVNMGNGFSFVVVKYPNIYKWNFACPNDEEHTSTPNEPKNGTDNEPQMSLKNEPENDYKKDAQNADNEQEVSIDNNHKMSLKNEPKNSDNAPQMSLKNDSREVKRASRRANILRLIQANPLISKAELAQLLGVSLITIRRDLQSLSSVVRHIGPTNGGQWQFIDNN